MKLINDYLSQRNQRTKISKSCSSWEQIWSPSRADYMGETGSLLTHLGCFKLSQIWTFFLYFITKKCIRSINEVRVDQKYYFIILFFFLIPKTSFIIAYFHLCYIGPGTLEYLHSVPVWPRTAMISWDFCLWLTYGSFTAHLTFEAPISQNGQIYSNNSLANYRRIVWVCLTFCGVGV